MSKKCPYEKKCGGCQYIDLPYEEQLKKKQKETNKLLSSFGKDHRNERSMALQK